MMRGQPGSEINSELRDTEGLLWAGKPRQGIVFRSFDAVLIPFGVMWTGLTVFGVLRTVIAGLMSGRSLLFALWSVPFLFVGFHLMLGRFIMDAKRRQRTFYAVTNQRVIIISGLLSRQVKSLTLRTVGDLSLSEKRDKSGTIVFGSGYPMCWTWLWQAFPLWGGAGHPPPAFEMIEDARDVYELLIQSRSTTPVSQS